MHAGLAPVIVVGGVKPNLVLVAVVLVTCLAGFLPGITFAFVAGLTANLLVGEPLGSVPLIMLVIAAMVAGGSRVFGGLIWIYPVAAAFVGSIVAETVAANAGIGHLMLVASSRFEVPLAFAGLIVTGLMGVGMYVICVAIEQRMTGWATRGSEGVTFGN